MRPAKPLNPKNFEREFTKHGGEAVSVEIVGNTVYGFGSELATLRCLKAYRGCDGLRHDYSKPRGEWYFAYNIDL